ncbi:MAG: class I SAM-dependent methyltransferase [Chloroflexi bacterium]|nr:class I SAM-dependent methyltransferase [Chloroflexota bacterium]MYK60618.1 class I SAM-dependent methyltransferase [Chloroflexota bacterium]
MEVTKVNLAIEAWREKVMAFDRYMEDIRGEEQGPGHGRSVFASEPVDPYRTDDPALNGLYEVVGEGAEILDVGGGAGRFALPLATRAKRVTVIDPSAESLELLRTRVAEFGFTNLTAVEDRWEEAEVPSGDVALCSWALHHVVEAAPFVRKLEESVKDRVVILEMMATPVSQMAPFYERVHGKSLTPLPGVQDLLNLLWAMDIFPDVTMVRPEIPVLGTDLDSTLEKLRRMLAVEEGTDADERLRAAADELLEESGEGLTVRGASMRRQAIVTWRPTRGGSSNGVPN